MRMKDKKQRLKVVEQIQFMTVEEIMKECIEQDKSAKDYILLKIAFLLEELVNK